MRVSRLSKTSTKAEKPLSTLNSDKIGAKLSAMEMNSNHHIFRCGNISIDPQTGTVKDPHQSVRLGPVNMQVLVTLLESQGQVVSRTELFDRVWKNQIISDDTLTRCISDLRSQLRVFSETENLIETLPKRGYRWISEVSKELTTSPTNPAQQTTFHNKKWQQVLIWGVTGLVLLLLLSTSTLWIASKFANPDMVRIALIPIKVAQQDQQNIADNLEDILQQQLLATENLRFLSTSAIDNRPQNPFPYLSREFGTQWLIEGKIREYQGKLRVSLNLVDARTAMVSYTLSQDLDEKTGSLDNFCQTFVNEVVTILGLTSE